MYVLYSTRQVLRGGDADQFIIVYSSFKWISEMAFEKSFPHLLPTLIFTLLFFCGVGKEKSS